jgi:fructose-1-phosphate kinase PfkB-like protein
MAETKKIFVIGLNPAWQVTLFFDNLQLGQVNRATAKKAFASGKGINFCRAATMSEIEPVLFHFAGGKRGQLLNSGVVDENIDYCAINTKVESRRCTTCLCDGLEMTEIIEPSGTVSAAECNELLDRLQQRIAECAAIALCGTVPPGAENMYGKIADIARERQLPMLFVDACKDIEQVIDCSNAVLKVNADEIRAIAREQQVVEAVKLVAEKFKLKYTAVTDGPGRAYLYDGTTLFTYRLPKLDNIISTLGAGDTCSAIFACKLLEGMEPQYAFAAGLATASASCLTDSCAKFSISTASLIEQQITIKHEEF